MDHTSIRSGEPAGRMSLPSVTSCLLLLVLAGCSGSGPQVTPAPTPTPAPAPTPTPTAPAPTTPFDTYKLTGDLTLVHDPSVIREGGTYYAFTSDPGTTAISGNPGLNSTDGLQIRCSTDKIAWHVCGSVLVPDTVPAAVRSFFGNSAPTSFWAPDVSFFNGLYHVYYVASIFGTSHSLIGLATNPTLDSTDTVHYSWKTDYPAVLTSSVGDTYNAIDPSILVDKDASGNVAHVWMAYGSYFGGIAEREIAPATGLLLAANPGVTQLATRPGVANNPIEGTSLVKRLGSDGKTFYYYLFASFDTCCDQNNPANDNYSIHYGRATSPQGPFVDQSGLSMLQGGGTLLLAGNGSSWSAPGGETVYIEPSPDATHGDLITFHALKISQNYFDYMFVNSITWTGDWPQIVP